LFLRPGLLFLYLIFELPCALVDYPILADRRMGSLKGGAHQLGGVEGGYLAMCG
jgi:hypothetical protein